MFAACGALFPGVACFVEEWDVVFAFWEAAFQWWGQSSVCVMETRWLFKLRFEGKFNGSGSLVVKSVCDSCVLGWLGLVVCVLENFLWCELGFSVCVLGSVCCSDCCFSRCLMCALGAFQHSLGCALMLLSVMSAMLQGLREKKFQKKKATCALCLLLPFAEVC